MKPLNQGYYIIFISAMLRLYSSKYTSSLIIDGSLLLKLGSFQYCINFLLERQVN